MPNILSNSIRQTDRLVHLMLQTLTLLEGMVVTCFLKNCGVKCPVVYQEFGQGYSSSGGLRGPRKAQQCSGQMTYLGKIQSLPMRKMPPPGQQEDTPCQVPLQFQSWSCCPDAKQQERPIKWKLCLMFSSSTCILNWPKVIKVYNSAQKGKSKCGHHNCI